MKRFECRCGRMIFFDDAECVACGAMLGFDPAACRMLAAEAGSDNWTEGGARYKSCGNRQHDCNWLVGFEQSDEFCISCGLNRTIPNLENPDNIGRWRRMEDAKRRLVYTLLDLGLPVRGRSRGQRNGLAFDFKEDQRTNPNVEEEHVAIGHTGGVITINVAEADDVLREQARTDLNERYRTLLGHFRHESGHYYFDLLVGKDDTDFRELFGDERSDYSAALDRNYAGGAVPDWQDRFISAYASVHPLEDWAETWSHYLHIHDALETAVAGGVAEPEPDFGRRLDLWMELSVTLNEFNRSLGLGDYYPFVISPVVRTKLEFVHRRLGSLTGGSPAWAVRQNRA